MKVPFFEVVLWIQRSFLQKIGLYLGSALGHYLLSIIIDIITEDVGDVSPLTMMFTNNVLLCRTSRQLVETKLEE